MEQIQKQIKVPKQRTYEHEQRFPIPELPLGELAVEATLEKIDEALNE